MENDSDFSYAILINCLPPTPAASIDERVALQTRAGVAAFSVVAARHVHVATDPVFCLVAFINICGGEGSMVI